MPSHFLRFQPLRNKHTRLFSRPVRALAASCLVASSQLAISVLAPSHRGGKSQKKRWEEPPKGGHPPRKHYIFGHFRTFPPPPAGGLQFSSVFLDSWGAVICSNQHTLYVTTTGADYPHQATNTCGLAHLYRRSYLRGRSARYYLRRRRRKS